MAPSRTFRLRRLGSGQNGNGFVERALSGEEYSSERNNEFSRIRRRYCHRRRWPIGQGAVSLRDAVRDLIGRDQKRILINLAAVNYIDSSGIGELVAAFTTLTNQGGQLKLLNLTKRVQDLLQITKLYTVFEVYDNEAHAIRSFSPIAATA
jgi:anti-sigma B factor antagonist